MPNITTPYMWSDNLSVDNALSSRQIIHQLISKINELVEIYNNLDVDVDNKIDDKLTKELNAIESELTKAIQKAFEQATDYTDLTEQRLNDKIEKLTTEGKKTILNLETELKEYTDTKVLECNTKIMELYSEFDKLAKNSFASVSPLDGTLKSNRDCFYDMLHLYQRGRMLTFDQIINVCMFISPPTNYDVNENMMPTTLDELLEFSRPTTQPPYVWGDNNTNDMNIPIRTTSESLAKPNLLMGMSSSTWGNLVSIGFGAFISMGKAYEDNMGNRHLTNIAYCLGSLFDIGVDESSPQQNYDRLFYNSVPPISNRVRMWEVGTMPRTVMQFPQGD